MAAPIAHVFLAIQLLSGPLKGKFDEKEFIIGTSFPDIRYLNVVSRDETHFKNVTFEDIKNEKNSFKAGMLLHSFVDEKREEYIVKNNFYKKLPKFKFITQTIKFAEDQILLSIFDTRKYSAYFNDILDEEMKFQISTENVKKWHDFLQKYFAGKIDKQDLIMQYFDLNQPNAWYIKKLFFSWFYAKKINRIINKIINDQNLKQTLLDFYLNFSDIFTHPD